MVDRRPGFQVDGGFSRDFKPPPVFDFNLVHEQKSRLKGIVECPDIAFVD
jgi:hypothetical protein